MLYALLGISILILAVVDILKTTLSSNGGGPVTNAVSRAVWSAWFVFSRRNGRSNILSYAGMGVLVAILLLWILLLWLGLFLLLLSAPDSIVSSNGASTGPMEKLYYAGFSLSTLGVGDYKATTDGWRIATSAFAFTGLVLITTSVTYFVPILSAVNLQSKISLYISCLGRTPQDILTNTWNGKDFESFANMADELTGMVFQHTLHHHAYPVLHYFHNRDPALSAKRSLAQLTEALFLLKYGMDLQETGKENVQLMRLEKSIGGYLQAVTASYVSKETKEYAPLPDVEKLREAGMPVREPARIARIFREELHEQRTALTALLDQDGWNWSDVYGAEPDKTK